MSEKIKRGSKKVVRSRIWCYSLSLWRNAWKFSGLSTSCFLKGIGRGFMVYLTNWKRCSLWTSRLTAKCRIRSSNRISISFFWSIRIIRNRIKLTLRIFTSCIWSLKINWVRMNRMHWLWPNWSLCKRRRRYRKETRITSMRNSGKQFNDCCVSKNFTFSSTFCTPSSTGLHKPSFKI